jgi:chromosome partitioning protein
MSIIAVVNNKGGVGKTTTTVHLAVAMQQLGKKVLAIDIDEQANLLMHLFEYHLVKELEAKNGANSPLLEHESGVRVASLSFGRYDRKEYIKQIHALAKDYETVLIDCPPSLEERTLAAIDAADYVLIPTEPEHLSFKGLAKLMSVCDEKKKAIAGVIITQYDKKIAAHNFYVPEISSTFSKYLIKPPVPKSAAFPAASGMVKTGYEWVGKKSNAALDAYTQIAETLISRGIANGKV